MMPLNNSGRDKNLRLSTREMSRVIPLTSQQQRDDSEQMSLACIVDEIYLSLMNVKETFCMINVNRKRSVSDPKKGEEVVAWDTDNGLPRRLYEEQARYKIYRIPVFRPPPIFVIQLKHLDERLKKELLDLDTKSRNFVVKEAVERICVGVDGRFFLLSVKDLLHWRLEK